jgi:hypothetical protein
MRRLLASVTIVLVAVACGDDSGGGLTAEEQAVADAILAEMIAENEDEDEVDPEDMRCFADGVVDGLGVSRLGELGISAADVGDPEAAFRAMTAGELDDMADVAMRCIDFRTGFTDAMVADGISRESAECLTDALDDSDFFRASLIASMKGEDFSPDQDADLMSAFINGAQDCLTPEELGGLFG